MRAAVLWEGGPPEVLRVEEVADPVPAEAEVLVRVRAVSIEGGDLQHRRSAAPTGAPQVVGYSAAGVVERVGDGVTRFRAGDRVATFTWQGSHAELVATPEAFTFPVPDDVGLAVAATVPVAFGTAHDCVVEFPRALPGEFVMVRGATGGVGVAAVQLAGAAGAVVIATATGDARAVALRDLGADHVVDGRAEDLVDRLRELTDGHGVDVLVDLVGGGQLPGLLDAMAKRGRVVVGGLSGGAFSTVDLGLLLPNRLALFGVLLGKEMHQRRVHATIARHMRAISLGRLRMPIDRTFPLADAAAAHAYIENGHPLGRVVLEV
jgi:NADPH:quinone reductase